MGLVIHNWDLLKNIWGWGSLKTNFNFSENKSDYPKKYPTFWVTFFELFKIWLNQKKIFYEFNQSSKFTRNNGLSPAYIHNFGHYTAILSKLDYFIRIFDHLKFSIPNFLIIKLEWIHVPQKRTECSAISSNTLRLRAKQSRSRTKVIFFEFWSVEENPEVYGC